MLAISVGAFALTSCGGDDESDGTEPSAGQGGEAGSTVSAGQGGEEPGAGGTPTTGGEGGTPGTAGTGGSTAGSGGTAEAGSAGTGTGGTVATGGAAGAAGAAGAGEPGGSGLNSVLVGAFTALPDYADTDIEGTAVLERTSSGETIVSVQVTGLEPDTAHPVHVHAFPCSANAGGGHYKIDPSVEDTVEENEIWPAIETNADGVGNGEVSVDHMARGDALSIVVHDPNADNAKMACADLGLNSDDDLEATGTFASFAAAEASDESITGTASFTRTAEGTDFSVDVSGLDPNETYASHVHALPCAVMDAGGHYKIDPTIEDTVAENELWPSLEPDDNGEASDEQSSDHLARFDAQSIVIHRAVDDTNPKVACADLIIDPYPDVDVSGDALVAYDIAEERGYDSLEGEATLTRALDGTTIAQLTVNGLNPEEEYPVHVHALPCSLNQAGGHYKLDTSEVDTLQENEIWLTLTTDQDGVGERVVTVNHVARADARSVVIHDSTDGAEKLACINLQY